MRANIESVRVWVVNRHAPAPVAEGAVRVYIGRGSLEGRSACRVVLVS